MGKEILCVSRNKCKDFYVAMQMLYLVALIKTSKIAADNDYINKLLIINNCA